MPDTIKVRLNICRDAAFLIENPDTARVMREHLTAPAFAQVCRDLAALADTLDTIRRGFCDTPATRGTAVEVEDELELYRRRLL